MLWPVLRAALQRLAVYSGVTYLGITVEVPSTVDTSNWTAADWKELAELCD
jgi:hypothetical protein